MWRRRVAVRHAAAAVVLVTGTGLGLVALAATAQRAAATATSCKSDGLAELCASSLTQQDVVAINYQVTQLDGPGTYTLYYTSTNTGVSSVTHTIGPLAYQQTVSGTLYAGLNDCYDLYLDSSAGTSLVTGPLCG